MSWLNRVRNAMPFIAKRETADNLWHKCKSCQALVFVKEWEENLHVCPRCEHHDRIGAKARFGQLFDSGSVAAIAMPKVPEDPLKFRDSKKYADRLKAARTQTGDPDAMQAAYGTIEGRQAVVAVQDFAFMGGSMGVAVGEAFVAAAEEALRRKCAFIAFTAAGGARMQEGILSLMQMPRTTVAIQRLRRAKLPYIVVLTDPTTGGVTASYAMLGDVQIAEPGALIGFAGQRVIEQTIREKLPEGFQRAEYLLDHGMVDMVVERKDLRATLSRLLTYLAPAKAA
ncbi:acetyl-CoA carboxylase carboxyltransferase subunit beta [Sphingomonas lacunae]|uniref:Acetyl-coenzyme A carboxylase carboxyl transferase subunit beta n=1 Tax=Sphingomonas lacunae TaxID=2698828 RepID=A0A6M4AWX0_9SPHN|nr:acetyl-CoA carboxylase, carboxyltransferase subunit beta [Sphingomonas lacunae]QJQ32842.1 acetyl-CoA carboxylase carboxyltransferase subunit beta [Sphingomonas lacunae]